MNFHHFIITRFNVNIYPIDFPKRLENTWLSLRLDLFQRYCFPTVFAQQEQGFTWLVLFDEKTPAHIRKIIGTYAKYQNFVPVYCGAYNTILPTVAERMKALAPDAEWFVTTRLDNDDALSIGFVHCLQEIVRSLGEDNLKPADTLYINFPNGLQLHDGIYYDFKDVTNAFVSLVERSANPRTVFWVDHPSIHDVSPVVQAETKPLWMQIVHDMNVYNYIRGERIEGADFSAEFPCAINNA
ncbi:hypothetical protein GKC30_07925 [Pseudodesulfovibrio sp. F-1]|uniref:Rhamnosyl transferase n=1 Tax=Pseudodesulfovibrio alkaliphilus TaxID=2661613 RepID=A0A7K1KN84_9BACT|nr:hypothetical protein [Pseudodesulfovibrio alkaliphilus]